MSRLIDAASILDRFDAFCFVDVRSQHEFSRGSIPGAVNLPLLDDEEHAKIGTVYKQVGKDEAMDLGRSVAEKKSSEFAGAIEAACGGKQVVIYCWRGGMRSSAVQELVREEIDSLKLEGGYKAFRNEILTRLSTIKMPPKIFVLYGFTGSGKTSLIKHLDSSTAVIDLEGLASHRGSIFGDVGLPKTCQRDFDARLYFELDRVKESRTLVLEGESKKIGRIFLPERIVDAILNGIPINIIASRQWRAQALADEYGAIFAENLPIVKRRFDLIKPFLGSERTDSLYAGFVEGRYREVIDGLLEYYYDVLYRKTMEKKDFVFSVDIEKGMAGASADLLEFINGYGG